MPGVLMALSSARVRATGWLLLPRITLGPVIWTHIRAAPRTRSVLALCRFRPHGVKS